MVLENFNVVFYTGIFLLPGYVVKSILDYLIPPKRHSDATFYLFCFFFSTLNCAIWSWAYVLVLANISPESMWHWVLLLLITLIGSSIFGIIIGFIKQKGWIRDLLLKLKLKPIHPCPTAWDYCFSSLNPNWVIVTLINGEVICGKCAEKSFVSSDMDKRDIYLEDVYTIDKNKIWNRIEDNGGTLILGESIKCIDFFRFSQEVNHGQQEYPQ